MSKEILITLIIISLVLHVFSFIVIGMIWQIVCGQGDNIKALVNTLKQKL
jgi:hypothetical protein